MQGARDYSSMTVAGTVETALTITNRRGDAASPRDARHLTGPENTE